MKNDVFDAFIEVLKEMGINVSAMVDSNSYVPRYVINSCGRTYELVLYKSQIRIYVRDLLLDRFDIADPDVFEKICKSVNPLDAKKHVRLLRDRSLQRSREFSKSLWNQC